MGVLYARLNDTGVTEGEDEYRLPTNFSYVVPAHYIIHLMEQIASDAGMVQPADTKSIEEILRTKDVVNVLEEGRNFEVREIRLGGEVTEAIRLTEINHLPNHTEQQ